MPQSRTVFVLGAGSSYEYGFPLGSGLRDLIINSPKKVIDGEWRTPPNDPDAMRKRAADLSTGLFQAPEGLTIDAFLDTPVGKQYETDGKQAIAANLLPLEALAIRHMQTKKRLILAGRPPFLPLSGGWYGWLNKRLLRFLGDGESPAVEFITFNYDRSLEYSILFAMRATLNPNTQPQAVFPRLVPIHHVYGELGLPFDSVFQRADSDRPSFFGEDVAAAASTLQIISEARSATGRAPLEMAKKALQAAERVVFLGFGFDPLNLQALGISGNERWAKTLQFRGTRGKTRLETTAVYRRLCSREIDPLTNHYLNDMDCLTLLRESADPDFFLPSQPAEPFVSLGR